MLMLLINDLTRRNPVLDEAIQAAVYRVLTRGWYIHGPELNRFESEFAQWNGVAHCVGVANGTDALELALRAVGVNENDCVVTVANAGMYSTTAIRAMGAVPVYVDVEPATLTMDVNSLAMALRETTGIKAIIVTHLYGQLAAIESLLALAQAQGIPLIEDCAQAHGATRNGQKAGSFGEIGCFSFYPTKNLGAAGDGGALITQQSELAERLRQLRQYGWGKKYVAKISGGRNSRLDELQAAILSTKLPQLNEWNVRRRQIARRYNEAFAALPLQLPSCLDDSYVAHLYVVRTAERAALQAHLSAQGISFDIHYPVPDHCQPCQHGRTFYAQDLPVTESTCHELLTLPCFPAMTDEEVERVIQAVANSFSHS
jgi:dTDP-3-amino-2,3,6-trideoxy-4-keto-D-glucose/dTDP-3-amino-3,4,6-trideoxy-alpha-D-glucose/dTDP-2,6-dideoxy-D-kanosamine transaminase